MYVAIDSNDSTAYYGASAEELIEEIMNREGEVGSQWEFLFIEKMSQMTLTLNLTKP